MLVPMIRPLKSCCVLLMLLVPVACRKEPPAAQPALSEPGLADEASVNFDIAALPPAHGERLWIATYSAQGRTAKFRIELDPPGPADSTSAPGFQFKFGKGAFKAEPGSDASTFLNDLAKVLAAKKFPAKVKRADSLKFTYAILGESESASSSGGFSEKPPGNWTAMKIFFPTGDEDAEVFLNFNANAGKAQFSQKGPDFGDTVLAKLATVL